MDASLKSPGPLGMLEGIDRLAERSKELAVLRRAAGLLSNTRQPVPEVLLELACLLPRGWWKPEDTAVRISFGGATYLSPKFRPAAWRQLSTFKAAGQEGNLEVVYLGVPPRHRSPFLLEEQDLLDTVAKLLELYLAGAQPRQPSAEVDARGQRAQLQQERSQLAALMENLPDTIYFKDRQHRFIRVNKAQARVLGLAGPEEALGKSDADFFAADHARAARLDEDSILRSGEPLVGKVEKIRLADGSERWVSASKAPLRDAQGEIIGTVGISRDIHELKELTDRLNESQMRLNLALEVAKMGVWDWHASTGRSVWSEGLERLCGLAPGSYGGSEEEFLSLVHPEDRARVQEGAERAKASCSTLACEFRVVRPDGSVIWVADKAQLIPGPDGNVARILGVTQDITEVKEAEAALIASEARLGALLINSSDIIAVVDASGRVHYQSASMMRLLGYKPEERLGKNIFCLVHPEDLPSVRSAFAGMLQEGGQVTITCRYRHADGSWRVLETIASNHVANPAVGGVILNTRDITEAHQAREQLSFQASLLEQVKNAVVATDARGRITYWNAYAETLYGWRKDEALGKSVVRLTVAKAQWSEARNSLKELGTTGRWEGEILLRYKDGSAFPALMTLTALPDVKGGYSGFVGVSHDISEQKRAEAERLLLLEREKQARSEAEEARHHIEELNAELKQRVGYLNALHNVDQAITGSQSLGWTLQVLLDEALAQLKVDAAAVLLYRPGEQVLEVAATRGFRTSLVNQRRQRVNEGYAGEAAMSRTLVRASYLKGDARVLCAELVEAEGFHSYYGVPLTAKGELKGVLELFSRVPAQKDGEWLEFLQGFATQAAIAIDNLALFEGLQRTNLELKLAYDVTIEGWARALELHDDESEGHAKRVTDLSLRLAEAMGLSDSELVHVRRGALLHDIGKMGVPDAILAKPDRLSDEEWLVMKRHPQIAYDLLSPIRFLKPALDIPYCHHERYDGSGYPRGLKGSEIPLSARIFAVVDVYDALGTDKPDRPAWPRQSILDHLRRESGRQFDPAVIKAFLRLLEAD